MGIEKEKSVISLRISKVEKEKLLALAKKEQRSVSQIIRMAINEYLEKN